MPRAWERLVRALSHAVKGRCLPRVGKVAGRHASRSPGWTPALGKGRELGRRRERLSGCAPRGKGFLSGLCSWAVTNVSPWKSVGSRAGTAGRQKHAPVRWRSDRGARRRLAGDQGEGPDPSRGSRGSPYRATCAGKIRSFPEPAGSIPALRAGRTGARLRF